MTTAGYSPNCRVLRAGELNSWADPDCRYCPQQTEEGDACSYLLSATWQLLAKMQCWVESGSC